MGLLVPEAGAGYHIHLVFNTDVIRLLHMVVVSWAGFGNQATNLGGRWTGRPARLA